MKLRSTKIIEALMELLQKKDEEIARLTEQVVLLADKPAMVLPSSTKPANVYYMDDARVLEMEEEGNAPT